MAYYLDLFSPETYKAFSESPQDISGFRKRQRKAAEKIQIGDKFLCYVTRISRWIGILEVVSDLFEDSTPRFYEKDDPFVMRFKVKPVVWLPYELAVPIHEDKVWTVLSFTKDHDKHSTTWTGVVRVSLREIAEDDGKLIENHLLYQQNDSPIKYPLSEQDHKKLKLLKVKTQDNIEVGVSIPEDAYEDELPDEDNKKYESKKIQALIAEIGERMGLKIWIPKGDRSRVLEHWKPEANVLLDTLPLNYDETTIKTIEQIDVIWLKRRSITRAFEVEHTTSIYSGILRMADLMALQPNIDIRAHIVAPTERKDKVLEEISRPVFTLLEKGPLSRSCSFISYDALNELADEKHLEHMTDSVIDEYTEEAED